MARPECDEMRERIFEAWKEMMQANTEQQYRELSFEAAVMIARLLKDCPNTAQKGIIEMTEVIRRLPQGPFLQELLQ